MQPITTTLTHRVLMPERPAAERHPALIMLHGRGADEEDLAGLASYLDDRLLVLSPRAPFPFPGGGFTWYEIGERGVPLPGLFEESVERLLTFVQDARARYPIDPARLLLLGFSMGTALAYTLLLTHPELVLGVSANSGYVPEGTPLTYRWDALAGKELLMIHGTDDEVIPLSMAHRARALFERSSASLHYHEFPMGHQMSDQSIAMIARWLSALLDR